MPISFDKSALKLLWKGREWDALCRLSDQLTEMWQKQVATGETEFEYLKNSLERDGKILGVSQFLKEIERIANSGD